ncbi:MAG TPA: hypothetical protein PLN41_06030 [Methanothrix sp.]|nr:hypothetical protein [Methanothrix sp.]
MLRGQILDLSPATTTRARTWEASSLGAGVAVAESLSGAGG